MDYFGLFSSPMPAQDDSGHFAKLFPRFVDAERLSRIPAMSPPSAPYTNKFHNLPASSNIEDRRNEVGARALLQSWTGLTPEDWASAITHPMTPFWDLIKGPPGGDNQESQLAIDAGINEIRKR